MQFDEYIIMFVIIFGAIIFGMYAYGIGGSSKFVIAEHIDYEYQYNQSIIKVDKLQSQLSETNAKLEYCEDYKNIKFDWSFPIYVLVIAIIWIAIYYINRLVNGKGKK